MNGLWFDLGILAILGHGVVDLYSMTTIRFMPPETLRFVSQYFSLDDTIDSLPTNSLMKVAVNQFVSLCGVFFIMNGNKSKRFTKVVLEIIRGCSSKLSKYTQAVTGHKLKGRSFPEETWALWTTIKTVVQVCLERVFVPFLLGGNDKAIVLKSVVNGLVLGTYKFGILLGEKVDVFADFSSGFSAYINLVKESAFCISPEGRVLNSMNNSTIVPLLLNMALWILCVTGLVVSAEQRLLLSVCVTILTKMVLLLSNIFKYYELCANININGSATFDMIYRVQCIRSKAITFPICVTGALLSLSIPAGRLLVSVQEPAL